MIEPEGVEADSVNRATPEDDRREGSALDWGTDWGNNFDDISLAASERAEADLGPVAIGNDDHQQLASEWGEWGNNFEHAEADLGAVAVQVDDRRPVDDRQLSSEWGGDWGNNFGDIPAAASRASSSSYQAPPAPVVITGSEISQNHSPSSSPHVPTTVATTQPSAIILPIPDESSVELAPFPATDSGPVIEGRREPSVSNLEEDCGNNFDVGLVAVSERSPSPSETHPVQTVSTSSEISHHQPPPSLAQIPTAVAAPVEGVGRPSETINPTPATDTASHLGADCANNVEATSQQFSNSSPRRQVPNSVPRIADTYSMRSLRKRFREASAKSRLALERLEREKGLLSSSPAPPVQPTVNLWATSNVSETKPVLLMPAANSFSTNATSTPVASPILVNQRKTKTETNAELGRASRLVNEKKEAAAVSAKREDIGKGEKKSIETSKGKLGDGIVKNESSSKKTNRRLGGRRRGSAPEEEEGEEEEEGGRVGRGEYGRPSSRGSAYDGYPSRRNMPPGYPVDWYRSYYFKGRPYSRASDREDWRYHQHGERYRPRSTQSYAGGERGYDEEDEENEGEDEDSENDSGDYDEEKDEEGRELEAYYRRHRHGYPQHEYYRYQHAYQYYNQQQYQLGSFDPSWQRYIMEYHRYYGQYPTYDQLHRMWGEQQKRSQQQQLQKSRPDQQRPDSQQQQHMEERRKTSSTLQQQALLTLQCGSGESQASISRHGSEKSFDIRSEMSSNVSGIPRAAGTAGATRVEKIREPPKHSVCHAICRFGAGGHLILVTSGGGGLGPARSNQSAGPKTVEIRNLRTFLFDAACQREMEKIEKFPGPLSAKDTAKLAVVQYCQKRLDELAKSTTPDDAALTDLESVALVWRFLLLLVRQNGVAMGNDLAQLLLETRSESTTEMDEFTGLNCREVEREAFRRASLDSESVTRGSSDEQMEGVYGDGHDRRRQQRKGTNRYGYDRTLLNCSTQTTDAVEFQFRQLLLGGNKKEALEWAIKYRLWGHALFLAMKVDQRTHTNVMTRFANSLALNDPLQTLYQLLSGGTPYAVTRIPDEKWGDWRPHLAMILSNLTPSAAAPADTADGQGQMEFQRQHEQQQQEFWSILTMGKTLMGAGRPYAAHFCFLCCHVLAGWDVFSPTPGDQQQKRFITLIGAYDDEKADEIFTLERYQCTEVYEYAIGLRNQQQSASCLPQIQQYKWTYTLGLVQYGYREESYRYLCQLYSTIQACPQYFPSSFAKAVYEVAGKLQQFDPTVETIGSSLRYWQQPQWLNDLAAFIAAWQPQEQIAGAKIGENQQQAPQQIQQAQLQQPTPQIQPYQHQQQPQHDQQIQQPYYHGLAQPTAEYGTAPGAMYTQPDGPSGAPAMVGSRHSSIPRDWERQSSVDPSATSNFLISSYDRQEYDSQRPSYEGSPIRQARASSVASETESVAGRSYAHVATVRTTGRQSISGQPSPTGTSKHQGDYWDNTAAGYYTTGSEAAGTDVHPFFTSDKQQIMKQVPTGPVVTEASPQSADFGTPGSDTVFGVSPAHPQPHQPKQTMYHHQQQQEWTEEKTNHELAQSNQAYGADQVKSAPPAMGKNAPGKNEKRNPSWFGRAVGSVIYKMMPKGPNEMILPDDKTKKIVWDADKQRWVNVDGDDEDSGLAAIPPPSDTQLNPTPDATPSAPSGLNGMASGGTSFLQQAYHQARQMQQAAPMQQAQHQPQQQILQQAPQTQQQAQQQPQQNLIKPSGALNRYRKSENRRYVDVFGGSAGGGGGGGGSDPSFAPPWPPSDVGFTANVFTPVGTADEG